MRTAILPPIVLSTLLLGLLCRPASTAGDGERSVAQDGATSARIPLQRVLDSLAIDPATLHLEVRKAERRLLVRAAGIELKRYPVVLGLSPVGDKRMEGDRRTPEGEFVFRARYPHAQWHKFIWIDYPNAASWARFKERKASGEIPARATIGGEIGIHGVPEGKDDWITGGQDWTWGCIGMKNADIDEIYAVITPRATRLLILP
jgi:murein L,D-transpeptidase YafK